MNVDPDPFENLQPDPVSAKNLYLDPEDPKCGSGYKKKHYLKHNLQNKKQVKLNKSKS